jgi:hypothetical protein
MLNEGTCNDLPPTTIQHHIPSPPFEEISAAVCVLFVGPSPPTPDWIRKYAKSLAVNGKKSP